MSLRQSSRGPEADRGARRPAPAHQSYGRAPSGVHAEAGGPTVARLRDVLGNRTLGRLIQPKLRVSAPDDPSEREADRTAELVLNRKAGPCACGGACPACRAGSTTKRLLRKTDGAGAADPVPSAGLGGLGPGRPLEPGVRAFFEPRFGRDLGDVRVHTGPGAQESARSVDALAYTVGRDVVFGPGQYAPGTEGGRRLLAHELTHVLQQASGAAPLHVQRQDWGLLGGTCCNRSPDGDEWALVGGGVWQRLPSGQCTGTTTDCDGMTCGGGFYRVDNLETGACRTPRHDDATFAPRRWTPDRARPDARSPTQRGSTAGDTPPGYRYDRELLQIEHRSGSVYEVPGIYGSESEFGASGVTSSLTAPTSSRRTGRPVTGGFTEDLSVDVGYGTGAETTAARDVEALIRSADDRIAPRLLSAVRAVAADRFVFIALRTFLQTDHGRLEAWDNDRGHYDGDTLPPTLGIGVAGGELDTRVTLFHELLHYVFDKADTVLGEAVDTGGADHPAIEALETRFLIVDLIRSGRPPLHDKISSKFGEFLRGGRDFFPAMREAIDRNDPAALRAAVDDPAFVRTSVSSGLLPEASGLAFPPAPDQYRYTGAQFRDLAFLWAQNAVIVRRAMRTAADISTRTGRPLRDVFAGAEWRREMDDFLRRFVQAVGRARTGGVVSLEARL